MSLSSAERLLGGARVDLPLHPRVVELGPAAYQRPAHLGRDRAALGVEVELPEQRGCGPVGQQAGRALGEHGRMQRDLLVREVEGLYAAVGLGVERAAGCDEGGDVGDRVVDPEAAGRGGRGASPGRGRRRPGGSMVKNGMSVASGLGQARGPGGGLRLGEDRRRGKPSGTSSVVRSSRRAARSGASAAPVMCIWRRGMDRAYGGGCGDLGTPYAGAGAAPPAPVRTKETCRARAVAAVGG